MSSISSSSSAGEMGEGDGDGLVDPNGLTRHAVVILKQQNPESPRFTRIISLIKSHHLPGTKVLILLSRPHPHFPPFQCFSSLTFSQQEVAEMASFGLETLRTTLLSSFNLEYPARRGSSCAEAAIFAFSLRILAYLYFHDGLDYVEMAFMNLLKSKTPAKMRIIPSTWHAMKKAWASRGGDATPVFFGLHSLSVF